ncbi:sperm flagellar protein 1-like [Eublepharis macularius]|uniref:Sperm flagellar protein 1 n=1 Tax=Eublepharis macularius TaxID=481883 RepID=A0AA97K5W2_EUBMA|nr:sperm flagellar protein 1 [Eublepharis macularius]XP_054846184.1 sperm flagellar protein 1 [Eublepharis macularius]XP_054849516.1 sperm flagellar protein 1-like [Eublepharis macularius]
MAHELDEESLQELYSWVDAIPLSRPKRNIARDFSDGVLAAEVVKFYFPKMVEMHNYVPANSTQQKLSNWGHLNRKVLNKLNFSVPEDVIRKIVQCSPGVVELVLIPLRQKIEEKQKQAKVLSTSYQELGMRSALEDSNYLDTGSSPKAKTDSTGPYNQDSPGSEKVTKGESALRLQLAEREQALLACQEAVQILQLKVRRLENLVHLKNVRIDKLTRQVQQTEKKQK